MKKILLIIVIFVLRQTVVFGADIAVVQSASLPAYNNVLKGIENVLSREIPALGPKAIQAHNIKTYILSKDESHGPLKLDILKEQPHLVVAIGSNSLSLMKDVMDIPVIYLMVPYPDKEIQEQNNVTGINMNISAEQQLSALVDNIPQVKRVGLLYDPKNSSEFVQEAMAAAGKKNISLLAVEVTEGNKVPGELAKLAGRIDCFWMLPDRTVLTPQTVDFMFLFSLENKIPILTFSKKYLDMGAVISVSFDTYDMGKQAGEIALQILDNTYQSKVLPAGIRKVIVHKNELTAKTLGIVFNAENSEK